MKVVFVILFVFVFVGYNLIIFFSDPGFGDIDTDKTVVVCSLRDYKFKLSDIGVYLGKSSLVNGRFNYQYFFSSYYDDEIYKIINECHKDTKFKPQDSIFDSQKAVELFNEIGLIDKNKSEQTQEERDLLEKRYKEYKERGYIIDRDKLKFLDFGIHIFEIYPKLSYSRYITFLIVGNLIILGVFEGIRRIFYYITIGSIKPKK